MLDKCKKALNYQLDEGGPEILVRAINTDERPEGRQWAASLGLLHKENTPSKLARIATIPPESYAETCFLETFMRIRHVQTHY